MRKYLVAIVAAFALIGATQFSSEVDAASSSCPSFVLQPTYTVFVGGSVGTAQVIPTVDPAAPRVAVKSLPFYVFDVAGNGHAETVLFGSSRDAQLRALFPASAFVSTCGEVRYYAYRIDLTGAGLYETVIAGSFRESQLRATGYIQ